MTAREPLFRPKPKGGPLVAKNSRGADADQYDPDEGDEDEEPAEDEEAIRDPAKKKLADDEAAKRVRRKDTEAKLAQALARVAELEGSAGSEELAAENEELRVANAFLELAGGKFTDLGAAFKLIDRALITIADDDGSVMGMENAIRAVATRYAFLLAEDPATGKTKSDTGKTAPLLTSGPSGSPFNGQKKANAGLDMTALTNRFPSLKNRIGR